MDEFKMECDACIKNFDTNFDMHDVAISSDIIKELLGFYNISIDSGTIKEDFQVALVKEAKENQTEHITAKQAFLEYVFTKHDNNDGKLLVDIQDNGIKYCFLDSDVNMDNIMDATAYMIWDNLTSVEPDWTKSEYIEPDQKRDARIILKLLKNGTTYDKRRS